tara:strand:+ start:7906 stop:10173 length:2268 start_codon:yes stop_codon:yes gene_type:complete
MANFVSPGVYVVERDISDYTPAVNPTVVGLVGFASKGEPNKAKLITSQQNLVKEFGRPIEVLPGQAIEGALEILETCNQLYFVRALDTATASDASAMVNMGACPALGVSSAGLGVTSSMYFRVQVTDNEGTNQFSTAKTYSVLAGTSYGAGTSATTQAQAMASVFGAALDSTKVGSYNTASGTDTTIPEVVGNFIVGNFAGSGSTLTVEAFGDSALTQRSPILYPLDLSGNTSGVSGVIPANATIGLAVGGGAGVAPMNSYANSGIGGPSGPGFVSAVVRGVSFVNGSGVNGLGYLAQSLFEGAGYNTSTLTDGTLLGNSITVKDLGSFNNTIQVNEEGVALENFKVSLLNSGNFVEDVINTGETNLTSDIIKGNLYSEGVDLATITKFNDYTDKLANLGTLGVVKGSKGAMTVNRGGNVATDTSAAETDSYMDSRFNKFIAGTYSMFDGDNGTGADSDAETTALVGTTSPSRTGMQVFDDDLVPITLAAVPGITTAAVQNALVTLAESTGDFLSVFGAPYGVGNVGDAIDYSNGLTTYRATPFNSSYAALYFPHVKVFQTYLGKDIWLDPAIFAIRQMGFTDTVSDLWFAPAGFQRGRLTKPTDVEIPINRGDRDSMYSGGNAVNPIVNFAGQGITIFGQRTTQREPTALDRINVRRLMVYVKRVIESATRRFIFEPNDPVTQEAITNLLKPLFQDIKQRRGITDFKVICDETVNTPVRVDRNELWCKVIIKPTKTAEILVFELNITNQSAKVS